MKQRKEGIGFFFLNEEGLRSHNDNNLLPVKRHCTTKIHCRAIIHPTICLLQVAKSKLILHLQNLAILYYRKVLQMAVSPATRSIQTVTYKALSTSARFTPSFGNLVWRGAGVSGGVALISLMSIRFPFHEVCDTTRKKDAFSFNTYAYNFIFDINLILS